MIFGRSVSSCVLCEVEDILKPNNRFRSIGFLFEKGISVNKEKNVILGIVGIEAK